MLVPGAILIAVIIVFHFALITFGSPVMAPLGQGLVLNEFIRHFEPAVYDRDALVTQHKRLRREVTSASPPLSLHIKANSRVFRLLLRPDHEVFCSDAVFEGSFGRQLNFDPEKVYAGTLEDDDLAEVRGLVTADGLFDGTISTRLEVFYIEPVSRYVKQNNSTPNFHTIVYRSSDVYSPQLTQPCASQLLHLNNIVSRETTEGVPTSFHSEGKRVQTSDNNWNSEINKYRTLTIENKKSHEEGFEKAVRKPDGKGLSEIKENGLENKSSAINQFIEVADRDGRANTIETVHKINRKKHESLRGGRECVSNKVTESGGKRGPGYYDVVRSHSKKRASRSFSNEVTQSTDSFYGRTTTRNASRLDTYYYNPNVFLNGSLHSTAIPDEVFAVRHVHKRATVDPKKTTCMLYLQADHLFYQKYGTEEACIEVMTRHVQRVNSIYKTTDFNQDGKPDNISFMVKRIKVHSMDALKDSSYRFPLNYGVEKFLELFSEEDYDQFCLAYMFTYRDFEMGTLGLAWTGDLKNAGGVCEKNGHYRGSMKSLNTGIVTLLNYGKHVPPAVSHVTLAHEIGHNFGSPHDPELCTPGGEDGNFIMFARATSGDKRNNNKFSPCSLSSINPVLNAKARSAKGCFTEPQAAICGNGVVEVGEECDCGWEEDCRDECCFPQRRYPPPEEPPCRLTPHSICSPSQGPCCTPTCELKFGDKCRDDNGCRDASFCDGRGPQCPPSINKPNKTICNEEFVCFMGECTGSICLAYGLESCQCIPGPHDSKIKACELCCKIPGDNQPCLSSFDWNTAPYDMPDLFSKPGTPCNDYNGYCDVFQKCREVDPSGPLATLRKLLLSDESIASFKRWATDHWYAVLLIAIAVLFVLVVSTKFLGKRPSLKLKSVTIIHSSTTETVRLPPEGEGGQVTIHPAAVRSKLPLKRKVREKRNLHQHRLKTKDTANNNNNNNSNNNNNNCTPKKVLKRNKKKKKTAAPVMGDEVTAAKHSAEVGEEAVCQRKLRKVQQQTKGKKKKKKEVIDYSAVQSDKDRLGVMLGLSDKGPLPDTDPIGNVKNWLLNSQLPVQSALLPKSKSTPVGLTGAADSPVKGMRTRFVTHHNRSEKPKSRSTGNLQGANKNGGEKEKLRLQVVYRPPFKFSLKLHKAEKGSGASASVVIVDKSRKSSVPGDRRRGIGVSGRTRAAMLLKSRDNKRVASNRKSHAKEKGTAVSTPVSPAVVPAPSMNLPLPTPTGNQDKEQEADIDSNIHTVPSDLEVLLSESEFLFSDA